MTKKQQVKVPSKKQLALDVLKNPMGKIIAVDLDGTLCDGCYWVGDKEHPPVNKEVQKMVWKLDDAGASIIMWTARPWVLMAKTTKWLGQNNLLYPISFRGKPYADVYIDDKAINIEDVIKK